MLNKNSKTFVVHIVSFNLGSNLFYQDWEAQIASLIAKKVKIPDKYSNCANFFSEKKNNSATRANQA